MGMAIGINLEYVRHADKSLAWGVQKAAEIGYRYVEPCFLMGRCLLSNAGYCHVTSMDTDPQRIKALMDEAGVKISALSTHSDLLSPEFGVLYARKGIHYAKALVDRVVHAHAKDISIEQADAERGKVKGTAVGCACGDGVIDWSRVVGRLRQAGFDGVLSVECGTEQQAVQSLAHLQSVLAGVEG